MSRGSDNPPLRISTAPTSISLSSGKPPTQDKYPPIAKPNQRRLPFRIFVSVVTIPRCKVLWLLAVKRSTVPLNQTPDIFLQMLQEEIMDRRIVRTIRMILKKETMYSRCFSTVSSMETYLMILEIVNLYSIFPR